MFVLVDYNKNYSDVCLELDNLGYSAITVFKLCLNGKTLINEQLEKISELKARINPMFCAVQVQIDRFENSTVGTINSLKNDFDLVIGLGGLNKVNRFFLEDTQVDFLRDPHNVMFRNKTDFIHHFNSGINQVLCDLARERDVGFLFSLNFVSKDNKNKNKVKEIGRVCQNVSLARKFKVKVCLNFIVSHPNQVRREFELKKVGTLFNLSSLQNMQNIFVLSERIEQNKFRKSDKFVCEGIEFK